MKRKQFLTTGLYGTASLLFLSRFLASCKKEDDLLNKKINWNGKVIIIGAGPAGMYAAHLLDRLRINVEVLEASSVYGGRVKALPGFSDFPIELGAEWVEGENSTFHDIAQSRANIMLDDAMEYAVVDNILQSEDQLQNDNDMRTAVGFIENVWKYSGADISVAQNINQQGIPSRVHHILEAFIGTEFGSSNSRIGMKTLALEDNKWTAGEKSFLLKGASILSVFEAEFSNILNKIQLNTVVNAIDYSGAAIEIRDAANHLFTADKVLVTVPVTVLKSGDIRFTPELPDEKKQAAQGISMDAGMKIIMKFSQRFWPDDAGAIISNGNVKVFWVTGIGRSAENNLLTAFLMGSDAEYMSSLGQGAVSKAVEELDTIFGAGVASGSLIDSVIQDWSKEPFIRGAYSYPNPGSEPLRAILAQTINKKIYFAGEATHYDGHFATVHGAMETAYRAVYELTDDLL